MNGRCGLALALFAVGCGTAPTGEPADIGTDLADAAETSLPDARVQGLDAGSVPFDAAQGGPDASPAGPDAAQAGPDAASIPPPGKQVLLYTGAGGGGPTTDLDVEAVRTTLQAAGLTATTATSLPAGFDTDFGVLWLMNPMSAVGAQVTAAAQGLVARGGRVVLVMEHCKNGCWGDAAGDNALLAALGSQIRLAGTGGAPLSNTTLQLTAVPKVTDGVTSIVVFYSGSVTGATLLGRVPGGDGVIAYEKLQLGDVVVVADSSVFGYVLSKGDNKRFVANLGVPLR